MVEIFRTNVCCEQRAKEILSFLKEHFPDHVLNFDLEDADRILRAEAERLDPAEILQVLRSQAVQVVIID